jgi:hypothetical protein
VRGRLSRRRTQALAILLALGVTAAAVLAVILLESSSESTSGPRSRWSIFEDHAALIRSSSPERRERVLRELRSLGADTLRVLAKWNEIAPRPRSARRPHFDASDPASYPGFGPYDDLLRRATAHGFRILIDLAPDAPRWATAGRPPVTLDTVNLGPDARAFGDFAAAVARRYSGSFRGLPAVRYFSIWNEPNHELFLKPNARSPELYRQLVGAALPAVRENGSPEVQVLAGETAPSERPGKVMGPARFVRRWLCLDERFHPVASGAGCAGFERLDLDGFSHHPYGPALRVASKRDVINLLTIRRLGDYLDRAAEAGRLPAGLPLYSTEFGFQSNPPDPTVTTTLARQAELLNEKEEQSYRYPRLRSYAQYLLYDDPPRPGATEEEVWSGFQTGLRFTDGQRKPAWEAYRLPITVDPSPGGGVRIWGLVRPRSSISYVQLERKLGDRFVAAGERIATDDQGYFEVSEPVLSSYRFRAYEGRGSDARLIGTSRSAPPLAETPPAKP